MSVIRAFIDWNVRLSKLIDQLLPNSLRLDGNRTFRDEFLPRAVHQGAVIYEMGGGSQPFLNSAEKERLGVTVIGVDIDECELKSAPVGAYDRYIVADLCKYRGSGDADVVICQATLEHVSDGVGAVRGIASSLRPGGRAYIFVPCRNAAFARLNLMLPQSIKRKLLFTLFPKKATGHDGFKAYYDHCTPTELAEVAADKKLLIEERRLFWTSSYFFIFTPAFILWRVYQAVSYILLRADAAETFIYVMRKPHKSE